MEYSNMQKMVIHWGLYSGQRALTGSECRLCGQREVGFEMNVACMNEIP